MYRIYEQSDWLGRTFTVVDTGGVDVDGVNEIEDQVVEQALLAQSEADAIILSLIKYGAHTTGP